MTGQMLVCSGPTAGEQERVRSAGAAVAAALGLTLLTHHLDVAGTADDVLAAAEGPDVAVAALPYAPGRRAALVDAVSPRCPVPLLVVPTRPPTVPPTVGRVLVPLDGTDQPARAVAAFVDRFAKAGADIVVLQVVDANNVPRCWDQPVHAGPMWSREFLARYCGQPSARFELRGGRPGEQVTTVARDQDADLVLLAWTRPQQAGRAQTVRSAVRAATVPVLLVPVRVVPVRGAPVRGVLAG